MAVVGSTAAVALFDLQSLGVAVVGEIPAGLPRPSLPNFEGIDLGALVGAALGITVVAYTDNVLTARSFAVRAEDRIDPQQEFLALSAANLSAGVLQGFPVSSSGSRTAVGDAAGSRTQLHSLVALAVLLVTLVALRPVLAGFPLAALAAIVVFAAMRLIDVAELRRIARFRRSEIVLAVATTAAVLAVGVLYGIAVAVALSVLDLLRRIARPHDAVLGYVPGLAGMHDIEDYKDGRELPGLLIYRYDSPLFFANADDFQRRALAALDEEDPPVLWFVLNTEAISEIDITGADALENLRSGAGQERYRLRPGPAQDRAPADACGGRIPGQDRRGSGLRDFADRCRGLPGVAPSPTSGRVTNVLAREVLSAVEVRGNAFDSEYRDSLVRAGVVPPTSPRL